jgi:hypothetical protein
LVTELGEKNDAVHNTQKMCLAKNFRGSIFDWFCARRRGGGLPLSGLQKSFRSSSLNADDRAGTKEKI